ncbi:AAA family ATPase (plasmid) [Rhizobium ruizarguesonis]|uniref:AAA family ATPase n=1 Tax=Rhizobium ruizarguesonis TaxID=2081791 RepID=A0ACD5EWU4_9HYPH
MSAPDLTKSITAKTSSILSEGEFRALSLACFFAEVNSIDGHDGIILDDPVSSLDHRHVRQVVTRIVKEAKKRQVIVFTHELSFYYELWHQATEASVPLTRHWIVKTEEHGFGTIRNGASPWQAKNTRDRLAFLETQLTTLLASLILLPKNTSEVSRTCTQACAKHGNAWLKNGCWVEW